jgi:lysozyme family protein
MPITTAKYIYCEKYWMPCRADDLPFEVRFDVFDAAVHSGVSQTARWLQRCCGAVADGVIGPQTIAAAKSARNLKARFNGSRLRHMTDLPTWPAFGRDWARRIADNLMGA